MSEEGIIEKAGAGPEPEVYQKIYLGPNIHRLGMFKNQVYVNDLPVGVKGAIREEPLIEKLLVDVKEYEPIQAKIERSGTPEHEYYERLKEV